MTSSILAALAAINAKIADLAVTTAKRQDAVTVSQVWLLTGIGSSVAFGPFSVPAGLNPMHSAMSGHAQGTLWIATGNASGAITGTIYNVLAAGTISALATDRYW